MPITVGYVHKIEAKEHFDAQEFDRTEAYSSKMSESFQLQSSLAILYAHTDCYCPHVVVPGRKEGRI